MKTLKKILAVDDNKDNLFVITAVLEDVLPQARVLTAVSGTDGFAIAREERPDLILLDVLMPGIDGYQLCQLLKTHEDTKHIPVIILTSLGTDTMVRVKALETGADAFLAKPVDRAELAAQVNAMLRIKEAEDQLREDKNILRNTVREKCVELRDKMDELRETTIILNRSPAVAFLWRNAPGWPVEFVSENVHKLFGYTAGEFMSGKISYEKVIHPDDLERVSREVIIFADSNNFNHEPYRIVTKHGDVKWVSDSTYNRRNRDNRTTHHQGIVTDITDLKKAEEENRRLEEQLRQVQKMEAVGTLAGGIAHDFNNILGIIFGFAELAALDLPGDTRTHKNIDKVIDAADRAKDLVQQILTFSRKSELEQKPLDAVLVVKETVKFLRSTIPTTIRIRQNYPGNPVIVMSNPTQIHQVVMNICVNAVQAMKNQGELVLNLEKTQLENGSLPDNDMIPGPYLKLTVKDTGRGMAPHIAERIFDPFFTTKGPGEGTGLGLSVVHGIIKDHKGNISVDSKPGKGTRFDILLPVIKNGRCRDAHELKPIPHGTEHILFVDDEKELVYIGCMMLENLGYKVTGRYRSLQALEDFKKEPYAYDLVISDLTMPNMTGIRLAKEMNRIRPGIPFILSSGFSNVVTPGDMEKAGIKKKVMKPLVTRDIAAIIRETLDE
jgi:PAS domain S-box-containing protein